MNRHSLGIYLIGNPEVRSASLKRLLQGLHSQVHNSPAVFYQTYPFFFVKKRSRLLARTALTLPEIGCARAHRNAYTDILEKGYQWALILEDDAVIKDPQALLDLIDDFHVGIESALSIIISLFSKSAIIEKKCELNFGKYEVYRLSSPPSSTLGYFINARACKVLHEINEFGDWMADWPYSNSLNFHIFWPMIIDHDDNQPSLIGRERFAKRQRGPHRATILIREFFFVNYFIYGWGVVPFCKYFKDVYKPRIFWWINYLRSRPFTNMSKEIRILKADN